MIEKTPTDTKTYNELLDGGLETTILSLNQIRTVLNQFQNFGNSDGDTALVVLKMIASVEQDFKSLFKSAAVSLRYLTDDAVAAREIAKAANVSPGTFLSWDEKSVVPEWFIESTEHEEQTQ